MLEWKEPPTGVGRGNNRGRWAKIAEQLKERPGEWALVARDEWVSNSTTSLQKYGCEATCRGVVNGKAEEVYARYIPVAESHADYMGVIPGE